jgi:uncharacterized protein (DUF1800 family)
MRGNLYMFRLFLLLLASVSTSLGADFINSATAPQSVTQDTTVSVEVSYQASTNRDIVVVFQLNSSPWTNFGFERISVSAGSSTLNIPIAIDANTPIASGIYKFVVYIAPTSGGWYDRLDTKTPQNSVSCIPATESFSITLDGAEAELLLQDKIDPIEIIEFSSDLAIWTPVARNYGDQWETVFPHAYALSTVAGSTDQAMAMAMGEKGFYRKRSTSTINASSNRELASRFLMQASFGPSRAEIDSFPNINSNTFGSEGDGSFLNWINAQITISPTYHRAHWRERSDPDYQNLSNQTLLIVSGGTGTFVEGESISQTVGNTVVTGTISTIFMDYPTENSEQDPVLVSIAVSNQTASDGSSTNFSATTSSGPSNIDTNRADGTSASYSVYRIVNCLPNEVGHNSDYGQQFSFSRGQTVYHTDWRNPLPGYGGLFDIDGDPIDENHPDWISATHFTNFRGEPIPMTGLHYDNCIANPFYADLNRFEISYPVSDTRQMVWFKAAIDAPDQLRQRVAWALSQYFVVGELGNNQSQAVERWLNYYDIFTRHAFGNFRDILDEVTWSPHMGYYLSHIENKKADPDKETYPDENYAREVMQLFTIGLWELNEDGTLELDSNGDAIATYDNDDIFEFAKVFTGMRRPLSRGPNTNIEELSNNYIDPMRVRVDWHDFDSKDLLDGSTLGPFNQNENGVRSDVAGLLDHLFNHKNVPPFFARFMIQRFTVSNPSPAYIEAVALAFKNGLYEGSGSGSRGCMEATIKAVLLHPEARSASLAYDPSHGKLREPLIRLIHVARAFGLTSKRTYGWFYFKDLHDTILQAPYESPSVFNYYRPDYAPNGVISDAALNAPEFQIHNDVSALQLSNALTTLIVHGIAGGDDGNIGAKNFTDSVLDFTYEVNEFLPDNIADLVDHLDLILCAGRLTTENRATILAAANNPDLNLSGIDKVKYLAALIALTPEFNTLY